MENGLKVYLEKRDKLPLVNIVFAVNIGSKDEVKEISGFIHLLEHLILLGGTQSYSGEELIKKIRGKGIYFNAHTSHDIMTVELSAPSKVTNDALELIHEKIFKLKINSDDLEREKRIILEELSQTLDDPFSLGIKLLFKNLFSGTPYENYVGGEIDTIKTATCQMLASFYKKYFYCANSSLSIVGKFNDIEVVAEKIKSIFGQLKNPETKVKSFEPITQSKKTVKIQRDLDITQAHVFFGFLGPDLNHQDRVPVDLLSHILGKGLNPLLYTAFRGRRRLIDSLSLRYYPMRYGGIIIVHLILNPKNLNATKKEFIKFLKELRSFRYSKEDFLARDHNYIIDYLETAKNGLAFLFQQGNEEGLLKAVSTARYILYNEESTSISYWERLKSTNSSDIKRVASRYLLGNKYVVITIIPREAKE